MFAGTFNYVLGSTDEEIITVGYEKGFSMVSDLSRVDKKGYGYEVLKSIENSSNFKFEFIEYDTLELALMDVQTGKLDLVGLVHFEEEYLDRYLFMENSILQTQILLTKNNFSDTYYDDPSSIDGKTVSTYEGSPMNDALDIYLNENNISVDYQYYDYKDYLDEEADLYLVSSVNEDVEGLQTVLNLDIQDYYFVSSLENTELINALDDALINVKINDGLLFSELSNKYFLEGSLIKRSLTREEASLFSGKTFTVGYNADHHPIQFTNDDGEPDGIAVEVLNRLSELANFSVDYIEMDNLELADNEQNFDFIINVRNESDELSNNYSATDPYLYLPLTLLIHKDVPFDIDHEYVLGTYSYSTIPEFIVKEYYPMAEIIHMDSVEDAYLNLVSGKINSGLFTTTGLQYVQSALDMEDYLIFGTSFDLPLLFYVSNDLDLEYVLAIDLLFDQIDSSFYDEVVARQTSAYNPDFDFIAYVLKNIYYFLFAAISLFFIVAIIIGYLQYKKKRAVTKALTTDNVTGLISMYKFREQAIALLKKAKPMEYEIISLDVDYFRIINNIYGYKAGSKVIVAMAQALQKELKDKPALVTRNVGENFIIFAKCDCIDLKKLVDDVLVTAIKNVIGKRFNLSMSTGVYIVDNCKDSVNILIDRANVARTTGKGIHETSYAVFDSEMRARYEKKTEIVYRMKEAIENREFYVVYQPKVDINSLKIAGAEALVRWKKQDGSLIFPNEFIPIFEANGFIAQLDLYVFTEVCRFIKASLKNGEKVPTISVNFSGITLLKEEILSQISDIIQKHKIGINCIEIEVTESALIDDDLVIAKRVKQLKEMGFTMSMDDFGSGVSSLNRLRELMVDIVKIDKAFLDDHIAEENGEIVIEAIINMAKKLNIKIVSEGVETLEQFHLLKKLKCDLIQGYYFDKPLPESDFKNKLLADEAYKLL